MKQADERIIVALDRPTYPEAIALVEQLPQVKWWKVGLELYTAVGPTIVTELKRQGKRLFLDLKLHDIPNTVRGAARAAASQGVDLLTVHASGGSTMLKAAAEGVEGYPCQLLAITILTSISGRQLARELQIPIELDEYVMKLAMLAQSQAIAGAVCSPHEVGLLRRVCGPDFLLVTPGIRPSGSERSDQQRVMTPTEALQAGSSVLVIGRPITAAIDPAAAFAAICADLGGA